MIDVGSSSGNCDPKTWMKQGVTVTQAAALISVSRPTIYNWLRRDYLQWARTAGGTVRINPDSLYRRARELSPP